MSIGFAYVWFYKGGLQVGSYTETTTPMAIHARMDLKNSLRPEIKFNTNPCQQDHSQLTNSGSTENFNLQ